MPIPAQHTSYGTLLFRRRLSRPLPMLTMKKPSSVTRKPHAKRTPADSGAARQTKRRAALAPHASARLELVVAITEPRRSAEALTVDLQPIRFGYFNPDAKEVFLVGSFNDWDVRATPLLRDALGDWAVELELPPGEHRYRLMVDGEWRDHPSAQQTVPNRFGGFDAVVVV